MLQEKLRILFFIKPNKLLQNGDAPIFARISIDNDRTEFGLKKGIVPRLWDSNRKRVKGSSDKAFTINSLLEKYERQITSIYELLAFEGEEPTPRKIQERLLGKKKDRHTILQVFREHNENAKKWPVLTLPPTPYCDMKPA